MSEGIDLLERFYREVVESGNLSLVDELAADSYVDHEEGFPGQPDGKDGAKFFETTMRSASRTSRSKRSHPR